MDTEVAEPPHSHHAPRTPEEEFLRKKFSSYYSKAPLTVLKPESREFGFGGWEKKIEFRHIRVRGEGELRTRLVNEAPLYISHSVAYYEFPDARPMVKKNWLGADLVFDLDAAEHSCGKFTCQHCMDKVKGEAQQLIDEFLLSDFGFSKSELSINFSGSRGYHVHVGSESVAQLDREARREIADYVTGTGLLFDRLFWKEGKKFFGPKPTDGGFGGKFARAFLKRLDDEEFALSISRKLKKPEEMEKLRSSIRAGNWDNIGIANREEKLSEKFLQMKLTLAGRIDANVTADTSKLIRMADSLHGGSGFAAKTVQTLDDFEPMRDAPIFNEGELKGKLTEAVPALAIKEHAFGPFSAGAVMGLPMACAVYLLCKKAAVLG